MIVITADQVGSRTRPDLAGELVERLNEHESERLVLPAERTVGDEIQLIARTGADALSICLNLDREREWSVGCGIGSVRLPLGATPRESTGDAFVAARKAIERAKKRPTRFALETEPATEAAHDAEALIDLLLELRSRRSPHGWELQELLADDKTQAEAAATLGITPQAVSKRAKAADLRAEAAALPALARLIDALDAPYGQEATR